MTQPNRAKYKALFNMLKRYVEIKWNLRLLLFFKFMVFEIIKMEYICKIFGLDFFWFLSRTVALKI